LYIIHIINQYIVKSENVKEFVMKDIVTLILTTKSQEPTSLNKHGYNIGRGTKYMHLGFNIDETISYRIWYRQGNEWYPDSSVGQAGVKTINVSDYPHGRFVDTRLVIGHEYVVIEVVDIKATAQLNISTSV